MTEYDANDEQLPDEVIEEMRAAVERLRRENTALRTGLSEIAGLVCCEDPGEDTMHELSGYWLMNIKDVIDTAFQLAKEASNGSS